MMEVTDRLLYDRTHSRSVKAIPYKVKQIIFDNIFKKMN